MQIKEAWKLHGSTSFTAGGVDRFQRSFLSNTAFQKKKKRISGFQWFEGC